VPAGAFSGAICSVRCPALATVALTAVTVASRLVNDHLAEIEAAVLTLGAYVREEP
jgi:hypothetical protein